MPVNSIIGVLAISLGVTLLGSPLLNFFQNYNDLKKDYSELQKDYNALQLQFNAYKEGNTAN